MVKLLKRIGSTLSTHRVRKTAARWLAVLVVFATTYSLVLPAITKSSDLRGELEDVTVRVVAAEDALPSGTALALNNVLLPEDAENAEDVDSRRLTEEEVQLILDAAVDGEEGLEGKILKALDISLDHSGDEIEPNGPVRLHIRSDLIRNANRPAIVHLDDEGVATLVAVVQEDGDTVIELAGESKEPAESEEPTEPAESEEATEPTEPAESEEAVEPAEPAESEEAAEPTEPAESEEAAEPIEPAESEEATEPTEPVESEKAAEPAEPAESEKAAEPAEPEQPTEPAANAETVADPEPAANEQSTETIEVEDQPVAAAEPSVPASYQSDDPVESVAKNTDELSGMTDSFSVYAIVDLTPKAEEEEPGAETLTFTGSVEDMDVNVTAPVTAFPEGTTMQVAMVPVEDVEAAVSEAVTGEVQVIKAVDITFYNAEGEEIEPSEPISVVMTPHEQIAEIAEAENDAQLVHIGKNETTVMSDAAVGADEVSFESGEFSTYVIVIPLGKPGTHTYEGDGVTITVTYGPEASLPEGTSLVVRELEEGTDEYDEYLTKTESALNLDTSVISMEDVSLEAQLAALMGGEQKVEKARFFDITLEHNGEKVEPAAPVDVEIKYDDAGEAEGVQIVHFAEEADGTERPEIIAPTVEDGTVTYQQESFSVIGAAEMAGSYGNGGWWYTNPNNPAKNATYRMRFRYKDGFFELGYPGNYNAPGNKDNADWSWPGDPGYPSSVTGVEGVKLKKGTTIEEILKALATCGDPTYCSQVTGVDFMMCDTYTVDDSNWKANGSRNTGAQETEVWTGNFYGTWGTPKGTWTPKSISINRVGDFGPLIHIKSSGAHPVHARDNVVINNSGSSQTAVLIENNALLMMEVNSYIIGGPNKAGAVGTGVYLDKGGSVEFFDQSFVTNMNVAVEQKNGKTRLKTSPNPFGEHNGRNANDGNTTGVALWPGQSIGKWTEALPSNMSAVPILLRDLDQWKSGDIVMDSGRWWYNEIHKNGPHNEMYGAVVSGDLGSNKFYFQNPQDGVNMALEYYSGGKTYTNQTVTNYGGTNQVVAPGEKYPVIRFTRGTVYNTNTNTWYKTLYDAVNNENPMGPGTGRKVQSNDTLVFYGSTVEDQKVVIPGDVKNLTIRTSSTGEMTNDTRSGSACTADINAGIEISAGASVTFQSGGAGALTLSDAGSNTIITNNGTLNLKSGTVLSNGKYAVDQNGTFNLYEGVTFEGNKTADVRLEADNKYITLQTANPATTVNVELANQKNGRDVVVAGNENNVNGTLDDGYLTKFPLTNLDENEYSYVYNQTGGPNGERVLELKQKSSLLVHINKVDQDNKPLGGAEFTILDSSGKVYSIGGNEQKGTTSDNGTLELSVRAGSYILRETGVPSGYTGAADVEFAVSGDADNLTLTGTGFTKVGDNTYSITVTNTVKTVKVRFVKTDGSNPLAGADFKLYDVNPTEDTSANPIDSGTSVAGTGIIFEKVLRMGKTYYLVETKTPEYYLPMAEHATILIEDGKPEPVFTPQNLTWEKLPDGTYVIKIPNSPGVALPNTGGPGTALYTTAGLALVLIAAAALVLELKRKGRVRA